MSLIMQRMRMNSEAGDHFIPDVQKKELPHVARSMVTANVFPHTLLRRQHNPTVGRQARNSGRPVRNSGRLLRNSGQAQPPGSREPIRRGKPFDETNWVFVVVIDKTEMRQQLLRHQ